MTQAGGLSRLRLIAAVAVVLTAFGWVALPVAAAGVLDALGERVAFTLGMAHPISVMAYGPARFITNTVGDFALSMVGAATVIILLLAGTMFAAHLSSCRSPVREAVFESGLATTVIVQATARAAWFVPVSVLGAVTLWHLWWAAWTWGIANNRHPPIWLSDAPWYASIAGTLVLQFAAARVFLVRAMTRHDPYRGRRCAGCGYILVSGESGARCPECFRVGARPARVMQSVMRAGAVVLIVGLLWSAPLLPGFIGINRPATSGRSYPVRSGSEITISAGERQAVIRVFRDSSGQWFAEQLAPVPRPAVGVDVPIANASGVFGIPALSHAARLVIDGWELNFGAGVKDFIWLCSFDPELRVQIVPPDDGADIPFEIVVD